MCFVCLQVEKSTLATNLTHRTFRTTRERVTKPLSAEQAADCRDAFVKVKRAGDSKSEFSVSLLFPGFRSKEPELMSHTASYEEALQLHRVRAGDDLQPLLAIFLVTREVLGNSSLIFVV